MLLVIAIILIAIWAAAIAVQYTLAGLIHLLLLFALVSVIGHYLLPTTRRKDGVVTHFQRRDDAALLRKRNGKKAS